MSAGLRPDDNNALFNRGPSLNIRLFLLVTLCVILLIFDQRTGQLTRLRETVGTLLYPLQVLVDLPSAGGRWASETLSSRDELLSENRQLRKQQLLLNTRLQMMASLEEENKRMRALLRSAKNLDNDVLVAEILRIDVDPYRHKVLLDKGAQHGAYEGQVVLDAHGVIGQILYTSLLSSTAIFLTDVNHATPVTINRSSIHTVALGTGDKDHLTLPYLARHADIAVGDLLVTSGLGGRFPAGFPVGRVTDIDIAPGGDFLTVTAAPVAKIERVRQVLLVLGQNQPTLSDTAP